MAVKRDITATGNGIIISNGYPAGRSSGKPSCAKANCAGQRRTQMTSFSYDMVATPKGVERHVLRVDGQRLPAGRFCHITKCDDRGWDRTTQWDSKHGRRTFWFPTLEEAMTSGVRWAKRRTYYG